MYKLIKNPFDGKIKSVTKQEDNWVTVIPFDLDNTDYQQYLVWISEGNTPEPADE